MKPVLFVCTCSSLEHQLVVSGDEDYLDFSVHLAPLPFWKRLGHAFNYLRGKRCRFGDFEEIIINPETALAMGDLLLQWAQGTPPDFSPNDVY